MQQPGERADDFEMQEAALVFKTSACSLRLSRPQENTWRLQSAREDGGFDDMGAAQILARDLGEPVPNQRLPFPLTRQGDVLIAETRGQRVLLTLSPFSLSVTNKDSINEEEFRISGFEKDGPGYRVKGLLKRGEALFGGGERFNRANQRGKILDIMSLDAWAQTEGNSYVPVPLVLSSRGYALFLNRYERSRLDLGAENDELWSCTQLGGPLDLYLFINRDPAGILKDYGALTGYAPMPASWLFGIQVCRHLRLGEFGSAEGIEAMMGKMEENDFPWDAVIAEGWETYNPKTYDDLRRIVAAVHAKGKKFLLYEPCGRVPYAKEEEKQARIAEDLRFKTAYLVSEPGGNYRLPETATYNPVDAPDPKRSQFIDITNPDTMDWWLHFVWGRLVEDIGVDGCKIDFCEQFPDHIPLQFYDRRSSSGAHLWYPTLYNTIMYRHFNRCRPEGGMCFSRGGGIGAQRYPFLWAGDQLREFGFLQSILTSILSSGLSGIPFMSYDMAGYMPAKNPEANPEDRVFIRGAQMSCFSSNMQTHGIVTRPYDFAEPVKDIYRIYAKLHEALRPYLLEQAEYACRTATPLLRHLFLYDPKDPEVLNIEDEYMLGSALLVAPVFSLAEERDIYLPKGNWRSIWDGAVYRGGTLRAFPAPLRQIPVFLLEGNNSGTIDTVLAELKDLLGTAVSLGEGL
jgi:alpha-glucosidase (family GH31 glycosyl hydrolase)